VPEENNLEAIGSEISSAFTCACYLSLVDKKSKYREKPMKAQNKEIERIWNDAFVERTGGYDTYGEDLSQLFGILNISPPTEERLVLDAGCGTGKCSIPLAKLGFTVIGVDISEKAVEIARQKAREAELEIEFTVKDLEALPFEDRTFDYVFCGGVLHHFPNLQKVETELYRVLKENGKFYSYEANRSNPVTFVFFALAKLLRPLGFFNRKFSVNERALGITELEQTLREVGFDDFYFKSINIRNTGSDSTQTFYGNIRNMVYFLCEKTLPSLRKGSHIVLSCVKEGKYR